MYSVCKKQLMVLLLCLLSSQWLLSQERFRDITEALAASGNLSGKSGPSGVVWIDGGKRYSYKKGNEIRVADPATGSDQVLFDPGTMRFPGSEEPFNYASFQWSDDFRFIVFRTNIKASFRNSGYADYYLYDLAQRRLRLVAEQAYTAQLSPDGKQLGFERNGNLFVLNLHTGRLKQLTKDAKPFFYNGRFGWAYEEEFGLVQGWEWSRDSRQIAYWQSDERKVPVYRYTDYTGFAERFKEIPYPRVGDANPSVKIGVVDITSSKTIWMKVDCGEGYIPRIYWTAVNNQLALVKLNRKQNHMELFLADSRTGVSRKIMEEKEETWLEVFNFGSGILHFFYFPPNAKEFFWKSEKNGWSHIYRYDYSGTLINQVTSGNWEMAKMLYVDDQQKKIYYISTESSPLERHLYVINFDGTGKKRLSAASGDHSIQFGSEYYIDTYSSYQQPKQVNLCKADGTVIKLLEDNKQVNDYIRKYAYAPLELDRFTTPDGQQIDISILKPVNFDPAKKYPMVLDVYGGPGHQSVRNQFASNGFQQYLTQLGYVVVQVNNRGTASYGAKFKKVVYGNLGYWECYDFAAAVKYMQSKGWIDPARIAIKGHSYGGFTAAYSVFNYPQLYSAAIIAAPVADWRNYDAIYTERLMGVLPENEAGYVKSSILSYVKNLPSKILITHSTSDDNVHVRNSMQLIKALIDKGKDADLRIYQSGGHGISYDGNSARLLQQQYIDFLQKTIGK